MRRLYHSGDTCLSQGWDECITQVRRFKNIGLRAIQIGIQEHWNIGYWTFVDRDSSPAEQLKREFASNLVKLPIDIAGEDTQVEQIGADAIPKLHVWMQVGGIKDTAIKALAMHNSLMATRARQNDEGSLKGKVCTAVPTRRVVPIIV